MNERYAKFSVGDRVRIVTWKWRGTIRLGTILTVFPRDRRYRVKLDGIKTDYYDEVSLVLVDDAVTRLAELAE